MKRGLVFINRNLGLRILKYLLAQENIKVEAIILNDVSKQEFNYLDLVKAELAKESLSIPIFITKEDLWADSNFKNIIKNTDFGVSALYGHLIPWEILSKFKIKVMNLHPSLLPIGRGADPIAWSILEKRKQGISLHEINDRLDCGPILAQEEIEVDISMNSGEIYDVAIEKLYKLFEKNFHNWLMGAEVFVQNEEAASYHNSTELKLLRMLLMEDASKFEDLILHINALTYKEQAPILRLADGRYWQVEMKLKEVSNLIEDRKVL